MTQAQIEKVGSTINGLLSVGISIEGGIAALVKLIRTQPTEAELTAIIAATEADATTRAADRSGPPA